VGDSFFIAAFERDPRARAAFADRLAARTADLSARAAARARDARTRVNAPAEAQAFAGGLAGAPA
jgi:hypothetical protein